MVKRRVNIFNNKKAKDGAILLLPENCSLQEVLKLCSSKLGLKAKKLFSNSGAVIDDCDVIRDNDNIYVSQGEAFIGPNKKGNGDDSSCPLYSIAVMGPGSVGKSAMTLQYVQGVFVIDYDPTIEDAYRKNSNVDGKACMLDILDTAGQEDYTALRSTWMRERDGFILVFSVTEKSTFHDLKSFHDQLTVMHETNMPPIIVVGNKSDLEDQRVVKAEEGKQLCQEFGAASYIETSAKTGHNIEEAFAILVREMRKRSSQSSNSDSKKKKGFCTIL